MSILSKLTGVHISGKGVRIEPMKALGTALTIGSFGGLGPIAGLASKIPGVAKLGGMASKIPGVSAIGGLAAKAKGIPGVGGIIDYAQHNPLELLSGINSAMDAGHARDLQGRAEGIAMDNYNARAPLRTAGMQGMLKPAVPDLSQLGYDSPGSVYGKKKKPSVPGVA